MLSYANKAAHGPPYLLLRRPNGQRLQLVLGQHKLINYVERVNTKLSDTFNNDR